MPDWNPDDIPDPEKLISQDEMAAALADETAKAIEQWGAAMLEQIANSYGDPDALPDAFSMSNPAVQDYLAAAAGDLADIDATTRDYLKSYIAQAYADGKSIDEMVDDMERDDNLAFGEARSELIARTEVIGASNFGTYSGLKQSGVIDKKVWLATPGTHGSRESHEELDGVVLGIDDEYTDSATGARGQHPGDFGDPASDCNCRCAVTGYVDDPEGYDEGKAATKKPKGRPLHASHAEIERLRAPHEAAMRAAATAVLKKQRAAVVAALKKARK